MKTKSKIFHAIEWASEREKKSNLLQQFRSQCNNKKKLTLFRCRLHHTKSETYILCFIAVNHSAQLSKIVQYLSFFSRSSSWVYIHCIFMVVHARIKNCIYKFDCLVMQSQNTKFQFYFIERKNFKFLFFFLNSQIDIKTWENKNIWPNL